MEPITHQKGQKKKGGGVGEAAKESVVPPKKRIYSQYSNSITTHLTQPLPLPLQTHPLPQPHLNLIPNPPIPAPLIPIRMMHPLIALILTPLQMRPRRRAILPARPLPAREQAPLARLAAACIVALLHHLGIFRGGI